MGALTLSAIAFAAVLILAALRLPLAFALGFVGVVGTGLIKGTGTLAYIAGSTPFEVLNNYALSVLPMFLLMGSLAVRGGLGAELVQSANAFLGHLRGGLAMGAVVSCAGFGAVSGSNLATLSTMSKVTVPEMLRRGYSPALAAGALASASTLDILIPPSIQMVIYATITETSIGRVMMGGIVPGIILTIMFVFVIQLWVWKYPADAPETARRLSWSERLPYIRGTWPIALVFFIMIGGMYIGVFSPTEAASVGAVGVLLVGILQRRIGWTEFIESVRDAVHLSAIIFLILIGIEMFHFFMDSIGLQRAITSALATTGLSPTMIMTAIVVALILLGCVMDATSIMFITTPLLFPIVIGLGYDGIWFGVIMVMLIQLGLIHPPFGLNVFVLASMIKEVTVSRAFWGCAPFVVADVVIIALCIAFPQIVLWLPDRMFGQ